MEDPEGVQPDSPALPIPPSLMGKRQEWPDVTIHAMRQLTVAEVGKICDVLMEGSGLVADGLEQYDFQALVSGLRKVLVAGLLAKDAADNLLACYGQEATEL
jgi:hypothetical protein